uniref:Ovule protein n=1 Tax=Heterorhabditis bacteriophora TaxID=37862 RepID=A0A1I7X883_HETBA
MCKNDIYVKYIKVYERHDNSLRNPLSTRRSYDTPQHMRFPTIGICNKMQLK